MHPAKVMRIGTMSRDLHDEMRRARLDEAARSRLAKIHNRMVGELSGELSPDLRDELGRMVRVFAEGSAPSQAELRVADAQLVGWLDGLVGLIEMTPVEQALARPGQIDRVDHRSRGARTVTGDAWR